MKYLKFILLLFVLNGCEKPLTVELIVENNTEHNIQINALYKGENTDIISVKPYDKFIDTKLIGKSADILLFNTSLIDSVNIKFDNERIIVQSCDKSVLAYCPDVYRNILQLYENFAYEKTGKNSSRYTYTITKEDYNNAVPIEE